MRRCRHHQDRALAIALRADGFAMPLALVLLVMLGGIAALYARAGSEVFRTIQTQEATLDTYAVAEGALNHWLAEILREPHAWKDFVTVSTLPSGYSSFNPNDYPTTGGIPSCGTKACERNFFPIGGGIIKNNGPLVVSGGVPSGPARTVSSSEPITNQLTALNPAADLTLNNAPSWTQVERLGEESLGEGTLGGSLDNTQVVENAVWYRLSTTARRTVRGRVGETVLVGIFEVRP